MRDMIKVLCKNNNEYKELVSNEDFIKLDSNFDNVVYQKLIAIYMFKQSYEEKDYSKEINELFDKIGDNRLINGPTP